MEDNQHIIMEDIIIMVIVVVVADEVEDVAEDVLINTVNFLFVEIRRYFSFSRR